MTGNLMMLRLTLIAVVAAVTVTAGCPALGDDALATGLDLFNSGSWLKAANRLLSAAAMAPADLAVRLTTGVALANVKRYAEALEQFRAASSLSPNDALPQFLLDGTYSELGDAVGSRQARGMANRVLASNAALGKQSRSGQALADSLVRYPQNAIAHCLLGDVYQLEGKPELAISHYEKSAKLAPKWPKPVFNLGIANLPSDPKAAEVNFNRVLKLDPSNSRAQLWKGDAHLRQKSYDKAVQAYKKAAKDKSLAAEASTRIGNANLIAGDYEAASEQFGLAARQAPQDPRPIAGQAQALHKSKRHREAQAKYQQAADVLAENQAPAQSQAYVQNQMAEVQAEMGDLVKAESNFQSGFNYQPNKQNADVLALAQRRASTLQKGIAENEAALKSNPKDKKSMLYLLSAYRLKGNHLGVINVGMSLVRSDPANAPVYYAEMGAARMRMGDVDNAIEAYSRALELGSSVSWAETAGSAGKSGALGLVRERYEKTFAAEGSVTDGLILFDLQCAQGDTKGMVDTGLRLVKARPDQATLWLRLGEAYERAGRLDMAQIAYARVVSGSDSAASSLARRRLAAIKSKAAKSAADSK